MKRIAFASALILCLTAFSINSLAEPAPATGPVTKTGPEGKGPLGWSLPFASQAMTDNIVPPRSGGADKNLNGNRLKFDHISDDTPPQQGIAPQKSQK